MSNIEIYARFVGIGDSLFGFAQRAQYVGWFPVLSFNPVGMLHHESGGRRQNAMGAQTGPRKRVELGFSTMSAISPLQNAVDQGQQRYEEQQHRCPQTSRQRTGF